MSKKGFVVIGRFKKFHADFSSIPTWTKDKHKKHKALWNYLKSKESISITSGYSSNNIKNFPFTSLHEYDVYEVPSQKTGNLMPYRGRSVLRIYTKRDRYNRTIMCFPLKHAPKSRTDFLFDALSRSNQEHTLENYLSIAGIDLPIDNEQKAMLIAEFPQWEKQILKLR
jgi:hypothetical protein